MGIAPKSVGKWGNALKIKHVKIGQRNVCAATRRPRALYHTARAQDNQWEAVLMVAVFRAQYNAHFRHSILPKQMKFCTIIPSRAFLPHSPSPHLLDSRKPPSQTRLSFTQLRTSMPFSPHLSVCSCKSYAHTPA